MAPQSSLYSAPGKVDRAPPVLHSVPFFPGSALAPPSTKSERNPVDLVASSDLWILGRLLPSGVLGSWRPQDRASWEGRKGPVKTLDAVGSFLPSSLCFLGWTTQPGVLSQPLLPLLSLDNEPEIDCSAKRKDALPHGMNPMH